MPYHRYGIQYGEKGGAYHISVGNRTFQINGDQLPSDYFLAEDASFDDGDIEMANQVRMDKNEDGACGNVAAAKGRKRHLTHQPTQSLRDSLARHKQLGKGKNSSLYKSVPGGVVATIPDSPHTPRSE